jgi:phospholipid-binding lipoprotein MlaA
VPRKTLLALAALATLTPACVCARTTDDPFERFNRQSFAFSIRLDRYLVGPFAKLSTSLIPKPLASVIHNIIVNLSEPQTILNNILQLRAEQTIKETTRAVVNTTVGLLGAIDVAAGAGIRHEPNGFGDTLGRYGVKAGPYLFIPILGPSDFRDLVGAGVDQFSSPMVYVDFPYRTPINVSLAIAGGLSTRADAGPELQALLDSAADPYATLKSTYLQSREAEIRGEAALPALPDIEGPGEASPSTSPQPAADATPGVSPPPPPSPGGTGPQPAAPPAPQPQPQADATTGAAAEAAASD